MTKTAWDGPLEALSIASQNPLPTSLSAVYFWRRCFPSSPEAVTSPSGFLLWLEQAISRGYIRTPPLSIRSQKGDRSVRVRADFISIEGITVGGGELSSDKIETLDSTLSDIDSRNAAYLQLRELTLAFGPVLYVGEADCLRTRVFDHLREFSPLRQRLTELTVPLDEVALFWIPLPGTTKEYRQFLEQVLTHALGAPLTRRPG